MQNVYLVVTSAFVLAGDIVKNGELVEVTESEAREFLRRGMARVATESDGVPQAGEAADAAADEARALADAEAKAIADAAEAEKAKAAADKAAADKEAADAAAAAKKHKK